MKTIARFVLLLLLAMSVPFHAAYGIGMAQCMALADGHGDSSAVQAHERAADRGHGDPIAALADGAEHGCGQVAADTANDGEPAHCGPCAACCMSSAITGPMLPPMPASAYNAFQRPAEQQPNSVRPSRLDRPPLAS